MIRKGEALVLLATTLLALSCEKTNKQGGVNLKSRVTSYCRLSPGLRDDAARAQHGEPTWLGQQATASPASAWALAEKFSFCIGIRAGDSDAASAKYSALIMEFIPATMKPAGPGRSANAILNDMAALMEDLEKRELGN